MEKYFRDKFPLLTAVILLYSQYLASWFFAKKFLGFLTFLAKILAIIFRNVRNILQDFSRSWKEIQENFWTFWQENQEYPKSWQEIDIFIRMKQK